MHISELLKFNFHWQSGEIKPSSYPIKRKLFDRLNQQLDSRFILTISGLRRTGKSVLQEQAVERFLQQHPNLPTQNILKFSFETEDALDLLPPSELQDLLELYFKSILKQHPQQVRERVLIAIDEIQNVRNWQSIIKTYYDLNEQFKFILTGSSSLYLQEGAESLVGRVLDFHLPCLDFEEFLLLTMSTLKIPFCHNINDTSEVTPFYLTGDVLTLFENFLLVGGFPDTALMFKKGDKVFDILDFIRESIIQRIVQKDLRKYFNLQHSFADKKLIEVLAQESGCFLSNKNLSSQVGLSEVSIKKHLEIFTQSALIHWIARFDKKLRRQIQATRKFYVTSPCIMFALHHKPTLDDRTWIGHAAETYALNQLKTYATNIYVKKDLTSREEIDFYLPQENLLMECKYSSRVDVRDFKYLNKQSRLLKTRAILLTQESWVHEKEVIGFPLFLL